MTQLQEEISAEERRIMRIISNAPTNILWQLEKISLDQIQHTEQRIGRLQASLEVRNQWLKEIRSRLNNGEEK